VTDPISDIAFDLLRVHGPLDDEDWARLLVDRGVGDEDEMVELVEYFDHPWLGFLPDGRNIALDALYEGRILTHRLTEAEIASGLIAAHPDFSPMLTGVAEQEIDGFGGATIVFPEIDEDLLEGRDLPAGYEQELLALVPAALAQLTPGTVIGLAVTGDRPRLRIVTEELAAPGPVAAALTAALPGHHASELDEVCWAAMHIDRELFTVPTAPLSEVLTISGLACRGALVAPAGFDFDAHGDRLMAQLLELQDGLSSEQALAVHRFTAAADILTQAPQDRWAEILTAADMSEFEPLADEHAAATVLEQWCVRSDGDPAALLAVAEELLRRGPRRLTAAMRWLAGRAVEQLDRLADVEQLDRLADAERHLDAAVTADPFWVPAVIDLTRYMVDRGEYSRAISLFDRLEGSHQYPIYRLLQEIVTTDRPGLGRNDRCWCGSGRKYKVCHLGRSEPSLAQRAELLYQRITAHLEQPRWRRTRLDLGAVRSEHWDDVPDEFDPAEDPLVIDVTTFEAGAFADYLACRREFLTAEDELIAAQWQLAHRSVYEVESVQPGRTIGLRDLRTGDRHTIDSRHASHHLEPGEFYCCHLIPVADAMMATGSFEPVASNQRENLLALLDDEDPDPEAIIEFLSARFAPTRLVTTDGEPMVLCEARLTVTHPGVAAEFFDTEFDRENIGEQRWTWLTDTGTVLGNLRFDADILIVEAMNEQRFDALLDTLEELDTTVKLVSEKRTPAVETLVTAQAGGPAPEPGLLPADDPEIAAFLDQHIRGYEQQWLDESIPALDGRTPRQAAADPTRRDDLIRLLNTFGQDEQPGQMSAQRLRDALGL
jgi:hypothetical protein